MIMLYKKTCLLKNVESFHETFLYLWILYILYKLNKKEKLLNSLIFLFTQKSMIGKIFLSIKDCRIKLGIYI